MTIHSEHDPVVAIRGEITKPVLTKELGAEHASYTNFVFSGTNDQPIRILAFDRLRKRAIIDTQGVNVYLGSEKQIRSGAAGVTPTNGYVLTQAMDQLELKNQEEVWCMAQQGAGGATVSVLNERYADYSGEQISAVDPEESIFET